MTRVLVGITKFRLPFLSVLYRQIPPNIQLRWRKILYRAKKKRGGKKRDCKDGRVLQLINVDFQTGVLMKFDFFSRSFVCLVNTSLLWSTPGHSHVNAIWQPPTMSLKSYQNLV